MSGRRGGAGLQLLRGRGLPARAAGLTGRVGGGRRAGRWPRAAAPAPWLCPREPGELLFPRGVRAVMFFLPPTFESPLPPRTHSSSRHNLRIPDLGGAPRRARSACTRGPRRRPVARSVRGARRLLSLSSFPAFAQVGRLPPGHPNLPNLPPQPAPCSSCPRPGWRWGPGRCTKVGGWMGRGVGSLRIRTRHSRLACVVPGSGAAGRPLG